MGIEGRSRPVGTACLRGGECAWIIREQANQLEASCHRIISTFTYTNHTGEVSNSDCFVTIHFSAGKALSLRDTHHLQKHCRRPRSPSNVEEWPGERHKELKALT